MSRQSPGKTTPFLFNRKFFIEILISIFFFSLIYLIFSQIDFKKSVKLQFKLKTLENNVFQLYYIDEKEGNSFNESNSIKIETKGSTNFQLVSFVIPSDVLIKKMKIEANSNPEMIEIKSIKMSGYLATYTWGPKDITINGSSITFDRDISRIYKMIHKTTENGFLH